MERLAAGQQGSRKNKAMLNEREADTEKQQQQHQQQQTTVELKFNFNRQKEQKEQSAGENEKQKGERKSEEETSLSIDYTHMHMHVCMYINPCICTYIMGIMACRQINFQAGNGNCMHTDAHIYRKFNKHKTTQAGNKICSNSNNNAGICTYTFIHTRTHRCMHARLEACKAMGGDRQARTSTAATTTTKTRTRRTGRHQVNSSRKLEQVRKRERTSV